MIYPGSLSLEWVNRVDIAPHALRLALVIEILRHEQHGVEPVVIPQEMWQRLEIGQDPANFALDALEAAGVIRSDGFRGRSRQIWLLERPR